MSATADCRKTGCTGTRGRRCKTAEGTGRKGGETRRNTHGSGVDPAGYGRKRMEQRITENMGRSLKEHGYLDPVFVGKGSFAKVYRVRDEKGTFRHVRYRKLQNSGNRSVVTAERSAILCFRPTENTGQTGNGGIWSWNSGMAVTCGKCWTGGGDCHRDRRPG